MMIFCKSAYRTFYKLWTSFFWCRNEAGYTRKSEWSVVPQRARNSEKISDCTEEKKSDLYIKMIMKIVILVK